ncbi:B12-binding domain-containing radical SAM protein [Anaerotalea alkaliphila]|uniref:DUF4080 domain-containing protein n=1 Tax=Anaerotalea alkaliphila TaxID=2662126 RepID=A0A7X5KLU8_9FIRM|nr:B12-binding domain-containing radical SAM protein [Anaerotalea alkaliphila]NDL67231.1 DUF4080 domain-containing protein [Anaerotalea alkaliphila]
MERSFKVLLVAINAKFIHTNPAVRHLRERLQMPGIAGEVLECTVNQRVDHILKGIVSKEPDVVGFSCYLWNIAYVQALVANLKKVLPRVRILLGGPEVSYDASRLLAAWPQVDCIVCGEGEEALARVAGRYAKGGGLDSSIRGICFRTGEGEVLATGPGAPVDMDSLGFPYGDQEDLSHKILYYETSRGCPYQCSYCLSSMEKGVRFRSLERVFGDLERFLEAEVPQVKLVDRTFNARKSHAKAIWRWLMTHDRGRTNFHFEISADLLDEESLFLLGQARPGLFQFEIGVQSANPRTLELIRRKMDLEVLETNVRRLQEGRNIHLHLDLIAGLPGEGYASFRESFNRVHGMGPDQLQLGFLKVLKGSGLEREKEAYGLVHRDYAPYEVLRTADLSYGELERLKLVEEMLERYGNSGLYRRTLAHAIPLHPDPFSFYEALGDHFSGEGLEEVSLSKAQQTEVLRDFLRKWGKVDPGMLDELLKLDLLLHERLRKLPSWLENRELGREALQARGVGREEAKACHFEAFDLDVAACMEAGTVRKGPGVLRTEYGKKDFVTGEAGWSFLPPSGA